MGIQQRRERERQNIRQGILQAALEIASEQGWQTVTIRRVAERIEYSPSAIYKYFDDKDSIFHTLLLQGFEHMLTALEKVTALERDPRERLLKIALVYWDFVWTQPTLYQLMFDLKGKTHEVEEAKAAFLLIRAAVEEWSRDSGVTTADLDAAVDILWAVMHGMVTLTMAQLVAGGANRARNLLSQAVNDLLTGWKMQSTE